MSRLHWKWMTLAVATTVLVILATLLFLENHIIKPGIVKSIAPEQLPNLYQVAVSGLLDQSSFFSGWSVGLIAAAWYVMMRQLQVADHPLLTILFILVCGSSLASLFLGQMLHEVVIGSIALKQDPLFNPQSSMLLTCQFWTIVFGAILVATAVIGRVIFD